MDGTQSDRVFQPSSDPSDLVTSKVPKEGYPASILGTRSLAPMIENLKSEGLNQAQIIKSLWGLPKNGKPKYKQAVAEYKALNK